VAASDDIADVVRGLEAGAVDYIKKPFELHELRARVNECLQRTRPTPLTTPVELRDVTIDTDKGEVFKNGRAVHLTMTEFRLIVELARHRGVALPRPTLLQRVWMSSGETDTRLVDMAIGRLRKKIEVDPSYPQIIKTVRGTGYVIE
jgi:two-component system response regulator MtrA